MSARIAQRSVVGQLVSRRGGTRRLLPAVVNWTLIVYALVLCAVVWGFAVQRIESDYRSTLQSEREHLGSVSGTLQAQVEAMLGDGVGASLAAANELEYRGDAGDALYSNTLAHMLTGGPYVRSLFLANAGRFVRVGRSTAPDIRTTAPAWMLPALSLKTDDAWVGAPIFDPENPSEQVIPIAQRVVRGKLRDTWAGALIAFGTLDQVYGQTESGSGAGLFSKDGTALLLIPAAKLREAEGIMSPARTCSGALPEAPMRACSKASAPLSAARRSWPTIACTDILCLPKPRGAAKKHSKAGMAAASAPCCRQSASPCW